MKYGCGTLLFICMVSCRTIEGNYYESFGPPGGGAHYEFYKNGMFSYTSRYDVGGEYGSGAYSIRFGRMKLNYGQAVREIYYGGQAEVTSVPDSGSEFKRVDVFVMDEQEMAFIGCIVTLQQDRNSFRMGGSTDMDGKYSFRGLSPKWDSATIEVSCAGYKKLRLMIPVGGLTTVQCKMEISYGSVSYVDSGRVEKYRVRKFSNDSFLLKKTEIRQEETIEHKMKWGFRKTVKKLVRE